MNPSDVNSAPLMDERDEAAFIDYSKRVYRDFDAFRIDGKAHTLTRRSRQSPNKSLDLLSRQTLSDPFHFTARAAATGGFASMSRRTGDPLDISIEVSANYDALDPTHGSKQGSTSPS